MSHKLLYERRNRLLIESLPHFEACGSGIFLFVWAFSLQLYPQPMGQSVSALLNGLR